MAITSPPGGGPPAASRRAIGRRRMPAPNWTYSSTDWMKTPRSPELPPRGQADVPVEEQARLRRRRREVLLHEGPGQAAVGDDVVEALSQVALGHDRELREVVEAVDVDAGEPAGMEGGACARVRDQCAQALALVSGEALGVPGQASEVAG